MPHIGAGRQGLTSLLLTPVVYRLVDERAFLELSQSGELKRRTNDDA
jgi:hypothetical protein